MSLFYYDEEIQKYEVQMDICHLITYLEEKYLTENKIEYLTTLIASLWYYYSEGSMDRNLIDCDFDYLYSKWKYYTDLALRQFDDTPEICYILGYTLGLHWMYFDESYKNKGDASMKKCYQLSNNKNLKAIAADFLNERKKVKLDNAEQICKEVFPSDSELDRYFRVMLIR